MATTLGDKLPALQKQLLEKNLAPAKNVPFYAYWVSRFFDYARRNAFSALEYQEAAVFPGCRHRGNDNGTDMSVHFVRRNDQTRSRFLNFRTNSWIEICQIHIETIYYHCHSSSSQECEMLSFPSIKPSSPLWAMVLKALSQPDLGFEIGLIMMRVLSASRSTSSLIPV